MRYRNGTRLRFDGADLDAFIEVAAHPFDPYRIPAIAFAPASTYISAVADLIRTYRAGDAWIRELYFAITITSVDVSGPEDDLDRLDQRVFVDPSHPRKTPAPLSFDYHQADDPADGRPYRVDDLTMMRGDDLDALFAFDASADPAARGVMARYERAIGQAFEQFFATRFSGDLRATTRYQIDAYSASWDADLPAHAHLRSAIEVPHAFVRRGLRDRLRRLAADA
jgi:hypothetical protein